jgi:hypothetical protein
MVAVGPETGFHRRPQKDHSAGAGNVHGDDDQIVPYANAGPLSAKLLKNGTLKT